ncbi:glutathione S-transferase family protein [Pseudorhodoplanes sp.]|uniref:glutathione S-transferase family protein n=1 Tax=Pseudorhodoplanes sp. TaxID=1934341 RepID=UPI003D0BE643
MIHLFYSPGACSMASHITLQEIGVPFERTAVDFNQNAQKSPEYLAINPRGKVPALLIDHQVVTENTAILTYLAKRFPEARLLPEDSLREAQCISQMAWFSNTPHISQRGVMRPYAFASDERHHDDVKRTMRENFWKNLSEIDELIGEKTWFMGDTYSVVDPYALVFYRWGLRAKLPVHELRSFTELKNRMLQRQAVKAVLEREKDTLLL